MSRFHALLGAFLLASCGLPIEHPDFTGLPPTLQAKDFHCCADPDRHPAWFTEVAMTMSEPLEPLFDPGPNSGYLSHDPRAMARIAAQAQPLDMLTLLGFVILIGIVVPLVMTNSAREEHQRQEMRSRRDNHNPADGYNISSKNIRRRRP